jgi:hypothetical protein
MAAVWSKKATINKELAEMTKEIMKRERGWGGAYGGVLSLHTGQQIEQREKYIIKICVALDGRVTTFLM